MKHKLLFSLLLCLTAVQASAEDGSRLWLRMAPVGQAKVICEKQSPTLDIAVNELKTYFRGASVSLISDPESEGAYYGHDGFFIAGDSILAATDLGLLYGTYELLRRQQLGLDHHHVHTFPTFDLRLLNHWDNPDGTIERGYAGESIFRWFNLDHDLLRQYARANASIGINGSVLNNVNASPKMLTADYLNEVKTIADILRPYGIRVYLSVNFASPMALGFTKTADPLNGKVRTWWKKKAQEIYRLIPDFGGFLVKANSEGQPGPGDYNRSHADGANMLADALKPFGGIVIWRCFVYGANHKGEDRVMQAVSEFKPLDGQFRPNVILQTKNGPLDFQPREPYSPIFDQITKTRNMAELQITQEYLGQSRHLVYLAPMWQEFFAHILPPSQFTPANMEPLPNTDNQPPLAGVAGVANIGNDKNWCGHHFSQANWYAFGRMAWDPSTSPEEIAEEWLALTFSDNYFFISSMLPVMMTSREACVNYMMPLGLHHIFKFDHHYGPEPDGFKADYPLEWCPVYYHQADENGVGFDRTTGGTGAVNQYREPYASIYNNIDSCPEELLLWFHHVPWTHKMKSGRNLWEELCFKYNAGVTMVDRYVDEWSLVKNYVDRQRWNEVNDRLLHQQMNAREWRDTCLKYFQKFSHQSLPE